MTDRALHDILRQGIGPDLHTPLGVAVSGGGDSMALLHLLATLPDRPPLHVVTLNHGLRPEAAVEAAGVAAAAARLGLPHDTLHWQGNDATGNLMAAAREARLALIGAWAKAKGIGAVALGHTADDLAETFLMRLARGSGVDGLSAMADRRQTGEILWLRPLLRVSRAALRDHLTRHGLTWFEDPTNDDPAHDRTLARRALAALAPLGIDTQRLSDTARHMTRARNALDAMTATLARSATHLQAGDVVIDRMALTAAPDEIRLRLIAHALRWITGAPYRPRLAPLEATLAAALNGQQATLAGCLMSPKDSTLRIGREPQAAFIAPPATPGTVWDARWILHADAGQVRALGPLGLAQCPNARATGLPRATLLASPALWDGDRLIAAPLAGLGHSRLEPARPDDQFAATILSH